jgi:hypothetical protein
MSGQARMGDRHAGYDHIRARSGDHSQAIRHTIRPPAPGAEYRTPGHRGPVLQRSGDSSGDPVALWYLILTWAAAAIAVGISVGILAGR